jgi:hypothetical protein
MTPAPFNVARGHDPAPFNVARGHDPATLRQNPPHPAYAITTIQPSAISAAGSPLYPELPIAEVTNVVATSSTNAQPKSPGAQLPTNSLPKATPAPTLSVPPPTKKP